eukprot:3275072-Amphidinium_carterae.1
MAKYASPSLESQGPSLSPWAANHESSARATFYLSRSASLAKRLQPLAALPLAPWVAKYASPRSFSFSVARSYRRLPCLRKGPGSSSTCMTIS